MSRGRGRQYVETGYLPDHTLHLHHRWLCAECPPAKVLEDENGGKIRIALSGDWMPSEQAALQQLDEHSRECHGEEDFRNLDLLRPGAGARRRRR